MRLLSSPEQEVGGGCEAAVTARTRGGGICEAAVTARTRGGWRM